MWAITIKKIIGYPKISIENYADFLILHRKLCRYHVSSIFFYKISCGYYGFSIKKNYVTIIHSILWSSLENFVAAMVF